MLTSEEYLKLAKQCATWAVQTRTEDARNAFLGLANHWTRAAVIAEKLQQEPEQQNKTGTR